ncbi:MAG: DUF2304 domain-containing protein [Flavobacteriales bacterium]|nr:DUF2304 domain-containing protein [Flavobacteriales bacterium]
MEKIEFFALIFSGLFLAYVLLLIVRQRLREEYAIFWILMALLMVAFTVWRDVFVYLADLFGFIDKAHIIFTIMTAVVFVYLIHFSVVSSQLRQQNRRLTQRVAILEKILRDLQAEKGQHP